MADELIDIVDENNNLTGIQKMKSEAHRDGLWHRASHIWIYNSKGKILIQKRAKDKLFFPDVWDVSVAGHVGAGEDIKISALREVEEEIGLNVLLENLKFLMIRQEKITYKDIQNNEFHSVYSLNFDGDIKKLKLQEEEVQEIKFVDTTALEDDLNTNPEKYFPHVDNYWFEMIKAVKELTKIQ